MRSPGTSADLDQTTASSSPATPAPAPPRPRPNMVFCAYCGKSFTRKEHLERHIPSHTNVKPHRCSACQLSFARRDLLQRHHTTYHEARDPMEPLPGGVPTVAGRTPIACQNCANAKTGCDKRVPCSRCAEKNLDCAARFARRSSKAATRAAAQQASAASTFPGQLVTSPGQQHAQAQQIQAISPSFMDIDPSSVGLEQESLVKSPGQLEPPGTMDPRIYHHARQHHHTHLAQHPHHHHHRHHGLGNPHTSPLQQKRPPPAHTHPHGHPQHPHHSPPDLPSPSLDDFMQLSNDFVGGPESSYNDLLVWPDYPLELDMYSGQLPLGRSDAAAMAAAASAAPAPFAADLSDISSGSEPMATSSSRGSMHTRGTSILSSSTADLDGSGDRLKPLDIDLGMALGHAHGVGSPIPEFEVVMAAEAAWPLARCNPLTFSGVCPRTAIVHLECLEQKSKQEGTWSSLEKYLEQVDWDAGDLSAVVPLTSRTRDKMLAITQGFLHKALEIHRGGIFGHGMGGGGGSNGGGYYYAGHSPHKSRTAGGDFNFIVLPPSKILEYFLRSYVRTLSPYYPLISGGCVDPNDMLHNNQASTLLVLLMIAQGAAAVPMAEARYLSAGLTETCRISLFDIIEKNVELSADPVALRCSLLFTLLGAWSGDKWLMDISMGQRGMYLSMLKHAGMLEPQKSMIPPFSNSTSAELQWREWCHREAQNRLVYNWAMMDQELSLFHDTAPMLSITELLCPLPGPELLWQAPDAERWLAAVQSVYGCTANVNPQLLTTPSLTPSLCDLFQNLLHDNLGAGRSLLPQQLRLLLHPLQSLLCHLRQVLSCFSDILPMRRSPAAARTVTKASTMLRLEEVQGLLQKWYELSVEFVTVNPDCPITRCNLVLYHLISLNAVTSFPEIERLARREGFDGSYWELSLRHKRCIFQREEAIFHCGQVLRLLRAMPLDRRPAWWSAALYRAVLILWADSVSRLDPNFRRNVDQSSAAIATAPGASAASISLTPAAAGSADRSPVLSTAPSASASASSSMPSGGNGSATPTTSGGSSPSPVVAIDQVTPEDPAVIAYLWNGEGIALLTRNDGVSVSLDKPADVLAYGVRALEDAISTRIGDGIKRKMVTLAQNWGDMVDGLTAASAA